MEVADIIFPVVDAFSALTLAADVLIAILVLLLITRMGGKLMSWINRHGVLLLFIVALTATSGSLFFSEVAGWTPCKLCWFQRIFMYPQVVLLGVALWKNDRGIVRYILPICLIGIAIAAYHYSEQVHATMLALSEEELVPCDDSGVSCAKTYTFNYGYISIPMMALSAFVLNAIGSWIVLRRS
jgi:disulfide bond formation protein DsbB